MEASIEFPIFVFTSWRRGRAATTDAKCSVYAGRKREISDGNRVHGTGNDVQAQLSTRFADLTTEVSK